MDAAYEHEPSTSVSTIRGLRHLDMTLLTAPPHDDHAESPSPSPYRPASPHSMFQSEPGSPSGDSISSFPSVSSSFHFSSGPTSPPHPGPHSEADEEGDLGDSMRGLIIPSLTLPSPSRRPTAYGLTLGEVRLLLLGPKGVDVSVIASQLVDDNEDVVEVGIWEETHYEADSLPEKRTAVLRVSTHWVEHRDRHGLERVEPARNVEIVELPAYDHHSEVDSIAESILPVIHSPFRQVLNILDRGQPPSGLLSHLLSSSCSPLYTALIIFATPSLSAVEKAIIESLSHHIPIIPLPPSTSPFPTPSHDHARKASSSHLSFFRPHNIDALRSGLFRTPSTLVALRSEAAARFLRWREVERAVERVQWSVRPNQRPAFPHTLTEKPTPAEPDKMWDKETWESQWEGPLSQEVALHLRRRRRLDPTYLPSRTAVGRLPSTVPAERESEEEMSLISPPCPSATFDPLHLPSLVVFSFSLFGALRGRIARSLGLQSLRPSTQPDALAAVGGEELKASRPRRSVGYTIGVGLAFVGAFCAGVGLGLVAAAHF